MICKRKLSLLRAAFGVAETNVELTGEQTVSVAAESNGGESSQADETVFTASKNAGENEGDGLVPPEFLNWARSHDASEPPLGEWTDDAGDRVSIESPAPSEVTSADAGQGTKDTEQK